MSIVHDAKELKQAIKNKEQDIVVSGKITGLAMLTLPEGATIHGVSKDAELVFSGKGLQLSKNNTVHDLSIKTASYDIAILNDHNVEDFGVLRLNHVQTVGQVFISAQGKNRAGTLIAHDVWVKEADVRGRALRPHGFSVDAMQGGFTLWNMQLDENVKIKAELNDIRIGSEKTPVRGSGVFVGGQSDWEGKGIGGSVHMDKLTTGEIYTDGGITPNAADLISAGVFVISNTFIKEVINKEPVTTYGANDMVLDNWGTVNRWVAEKDVTSHGPSGIGFVNFANLDHLEVKGPIITTGKGARGFNHYDGNLKTASFLSIATTGDASIGIQVSKPMESITIDRDLSTFGAEGMSLVRGVQTKMQAVALSIKDGGPVGKINVGGYISTTGEKVASVEIADKVGELQVKEGVRALGDNSDAIRIKPGVSVNLNGVKAYARNGHSVTKLKQDKK